MRLFGCDPEELRLAERAMYEAQMERDMVRHELDSANTERGLLRSKVKALEQENEELKRAALQRREQPVIDPFAGLPSEIRSQIDYAALGLKEPD